MYRDKTLIPTEALRLLALGLLADAPKRYRDLAAEIRHFTSHVTGPSLDLLVAYEELTAPSLWCASQRCYLMFLRRHMHLTCL